MALLASTAMADGPSSTEPTTVMRGPPTARTFNDVAGLGHTTANRTIGHYDWENVSAEQRAMKWPTDPSGARVWGLAVFASAILMLGLTLTYRSLRAETRRDLVSYRPRGPHMGRGPV